ncbi:MAG TPA: hypothetical protein VKM55_09960 [Candidatus Lokiarchaeia archaeon]|nr:hypothetical protein [Candidatus Lokiarchaeia archaeon]
MSWERKQPVVLSIIIFALCLLLVLNMLPALLAGYVASIFMVIGPLLGVYTGIQFLKNDADGFGGIIFHLFILYCGIYYLVLSISDIVTIVSHAVEVLPVIIDFAIAGLGWLGFFMYYD